MGDAYRVGILIGHGLQCPLPEAAEWAKAAVREILSSALDLSVWVDEASLNGLRRVADKQCQLLIFYGHGTEDGRLCFVDGRKSYDELSERIGLENFWDSLSGALLMACHSRVFAQSLSCPWLGFGDEILRLAPKGFMQALWQKLRRLPLNQAIVESHAACRETMESSFPECLEFSERAWPGHSFSAGRPQLLRGTPALTERLDVDYASVVLDERSYPEHDPFVGRVTDLQRLFALPSRNSDQPLQQRYWIYGDAGIGKSALLRQHTCNVRDLAFADNDQPVWLLHAYCMNCIQPDDVWRMIIGKAQRLYGWESAPDSWYSLFQRLGATRGTHVWVMDDLTYLRTIPGREQEAQKVPQTIYDAAHVAAVPIQLVVSARFGAPPGWTGIEVRELDETEALDLASLVKQQAGLGISEGDKLDASRLFARCGRSTVHYKRALMLAVARGQTYGAMCNELAEIGALDVLDESDFSERMVRKEAEQLDQLSARDGFRYREFLGAYEPLVRRAGNFTRKELLEWWPCEFLVSGSRLSVERAYANGLTRLVRLGFLAARNDHGREVYYMPPNQRLTMRALADSTRKIPKAIPFRAPSERLSAALERAKKGQFAAVGEILAIEQEYVPDIDEVEAAIVVCRAMLVRAEVVAIIKDDAAASLSVYDEVRDLFAARDELPLTEQVAKALVNKGFTLGQLGRREDELAVYDEVHKLFAARAELPIAEPVARALVNKGVTLGQLGRAEEEMAVYDEVHRLFAARAELPLAEAVTKALVNKGFTLSQLGRREEELAVYDETYTLFATRAELPLALLVARALVNKGVTLGQLGHAEEEMAEYDEVHRLFAARTELPLAEQVARSLLIKGIRLDQNGRWEEALAVYDEVHRLFAARAELSLAEQVANALFSKGGTLLLGGRGDEAIACFAELLDRYEHSPSPAIQQTLQQLHQLLEELS